MNRYQTIVACIVVAILLVVIVVAILVWRMSDTGTEDKAASLDTPIGQSEDLLENDATGQNATTDDLAEEESLAERRANAVNHLIEIVGKSFLENPNYRLDGFLIPASADKLDYYDWSNIYYNDVSIDRLDGIIEPGSFGSDTGRRLQGYWDEFADLPDGFSGWADTDNAAELALWHQFLLDNSIMPVEANEDNVYIWFSASCHDQLPIPLGGSGLLTVAFVYSGSNSSVCRGIFFQAPQCYEFDDLIYDVASWQDSEGILTGGSREHQCL